MKNNIKLPFGLINGQLKHIDDVANGRACDCVCPGCKQPLEARNAGKIKAHHFAHYNTDECKHGTETAIHLMAKQIIYETKKVETPLFFREFLKQKDIDGNYCYGKQIKIEPKIIEADDAIYDGERKEYREEYRPDVTLIYKGRSLLIEIKVTHAVTEKKLLKVKKNNEAMLEIDLSNVNSEIVLDIAKFQDYVIHKAPRHWIYNPYGEYCYKNAQVELSNEREKHIEKLKELKSYSSKYWQKQHEIIQQKSIVNFPIIEKIKDFERCQKTEVLIGVCVKNDWIFEVHRSVWQASILTEIIFNNENTKKIKAWKVEKFITSKYDILPIVKELSNIKREYNKEKIENDNSYQNTHGCWFLSEQEIKLIPSPFKPIIEYLNYLSTLGIIKHRGNNIFSILISNSKQYLDYINAKIERRKTELEELKQIEIAKKEEVKRREIELEQERIIITEEGKRKIERLLKIVNAMEYQRAKEIIASEKRVFTLFNGKGRLCKCCYFFSHISDNYNCPFCGKNKFQISFISAFDIENTVHRHKYTTNPGLSVKSGLKINTNLLAEFLI